MVKNIIARLAKKSPLQETDGQETSTGSEEEDEQ
jgi:hypothetical protein